MNTPTITTMINVNYSNDKIFTDILEYRNVKKHRITNNALNNSHFTNINPNGKNVKIKKLTYNGVNCVYRGYDIKDIFIDKNKYIITFKRNTDKFMFNGFKNSDIDMNNKEIFLDKMKYIILIC